MIEEFMESLIKIDDLTNDKISLKDLETSSQWDQVLKFIRDNTNKQIFKTWFEPIKVVEITEDKIKLGVPSQFFYEWIEEHYSELLNISIKNVFNKSLQVEYQIVFTNNLKKKSSKVISLPGNNKIPLNQQFIEFDPIEIKERQFESNLNPRYSFDNFITGDSNQLAKSAALAVAENPGKTRYNPLVIYGDTGLGKTHIVQAIGNEITKNHSKLKVLYSNSEKFTNDFIEAIQKNKLAEFTSFYRKMDVLIIDDIQFFEGKEKTQDIFFHTFNSLYHSGKQIILTSDKTPAELKDVDDRLISRFKSGLIADISAPDYEMRLAILRQKSYAEGITLPTVVAEYIARHIKTSIRELEGAIISLIAKVTLERKPLDLQLAKEVVYGTSNVEKEISVDLIKKVVSEYYRVSIDDIISKSRKLEIAIARHMAIYLTKMLTPLSLKMIGANFGKRDHSTVLHSCQTIENYIETDSKVKEAYNYFVDLLKSY